MVNGCLTVHIRDYHDYIGNMSLERSDGLISAQVTTSNRVLKLGPGFVTSAEISPSLRTQRFSTHFLLQRYVYLERYSASARWADLIVHPL